MRCVIAVHRAETPSPVTPAQLRTLECASRGQTCQSTAELLGVSVEAVKSSLKLARRALRAKNTTHAACEALRQGLIS